MISQCYGNDISDAVYFESSLGREFMPGKNARVVTRIAGVGANRRTVGKPNALIATACLKPCHTMPSFHCVGKALFDFPERREIARKI